MAYNKGALEKIGTGGHDFPGWEVVIMFYDAVIVVDGHVASRGKPPPRNHKARQYLVETLLPHLCEPYEYLHSASISARYYNGYAMADDIRCECVRCHEAIMNGV